MSLARISTSKQAGCIRIPNKPRRKQRKWTPSPHSLRLSELSWLTDTLGNKFYTLSIFFFHTHQAYCAQLFVIWVLPSHQKYVRRSLYTWRGEPHDIEYAIVFQVSAPCDSSRLSKLYCRIFCPPPTMGEFHRYVFDRCAHHYIYYVTLLLILLTFFMLLYC